MLKTFIRFLGGAAICALMTLAAAPSALPAAAAGVKVTVNCGTGQTNDYADIPTALGQVPTTSGGTITVCNGGYSPFTVDGYTAPLKIIGKPGAGIVGNLSSAYQIHVLNSTNVTISGFLLTGSMLPGSTDVVGIAYVNSGGAITGNVIRNMRSSSGVGIFVEQAAGKISITRNSIINAQSNGIQITNSTGQIAIGGNRIYWSGEVSLGSTGVSLVNLPNGASVKGNKIEADWNPDTGNSPIGVLVDGTSQARVTGNTIEHVKQGIYIVSSSVVPSSLNLISGNTIADTETGISIDTAGAGVANSNVLKANKIYNNVTGDFGIILNNGGASIDQTTISGNSIFGDWSLAYIDEFGASNIIGISPKQTNKTGPIVPPGK